MITYIFRYNDDFSVFATDKGLQYAREQVLRMLELKYNRVIHYGDVVESTMKERNDFMERNFVSPNLL